MSKLCRWIARVASKGLEPIEWETVQGDILESGETGPQALRDVVGLVVRRQAALWTDWQPWLAAIGVAGAAGAFLSEIISHKILGIGLILDTYFRYGVHYDTGVTAGQDIFSLACSLLAISTWSWISCYALGSLSGRTIWITAPLFYLVVVNSYWVSLLISGAITIRNARLPIILVSALLPHNFPVLLFLPAAIWGMRRGLQQRALSRRRTLFLTGAIAVLTVLMIWTGGWYEAARQNWSQGAWRPVPWHTRLLPLAIVSWPLGYLLAISRAGAGLAAKENRI
jgi:hypothetical protein